MPHIHEKVDFTAEVFIIHSGRVLLRKHDKYKIWLGVGGHIEPDEDPNQAAIREVKEEVGLDVKLFGDVPKLGEEGRDYHELIAPRFVNRHRISATHEHVSDVFFAKSDTDKIKAAEDEVSEEIKWFSKEDLNSEDYGLKDHVRYYAKKALEEVR